MAETLQSAVPQVRRCHPEEAAAALAIIQEAARWTSRFGSEIWDPGSFSLPQHQTLAEAGELVGGFADGQMCARMWLQTRDPVIWPADAPHEAVYVHKLAVRRENAGQGWPGRLMEYAAEQAATAGARFVRLDTIPNPRLIGIYTRMGCVLVDPVPRLLGGRLLVRLERRLVV